MAPPRPPVRTRPELRLMRAADAAAVALLAEKLNRHFGVAAPAFGASAIAPLLEGDPPFLSGLIAETGDRSTTREPVAYALAQDFFDTDTGRMGLWLFDLYVEPDWRGAGLGRSMIAALAARAAGQGKGMIALAAYRSNPARRLYERIGAALPEEALVYELRDEKLQALADEAPAL
ncbi:MAG: GNAT family N-acetyltransferase [Marivibrio sp.]|uniref:GNAT family N-acetyltransferase n=1 Tax=Marivibrio sp. TaxID=2039719 RepID=UPI0032EDD7AD